jgi:hypothetical protein
MDDNDLNKEEDKLVHDSKVQNENQQQQRHQSTYSKRKGLLDTSKEIRTSAWITLAILGSTILITMYGETMLLPAIRDIIRDFDISYSTSSWILTAYLIAGAVATPIAGKFC